ncbi:flavodoxin [Orenia marismortui]|uniref:flavodoxin n=1 Tax=Orenia marismortui TaxID=46469 RepID=UPI000377675A|nr:flavodoxin [Orenia marismortui]
MKTIILYGSTTGSTESLAESLASALDDKFEVLIKDVSKANVDELNNFDLILFGSSTWGSGELQDDFYDFYNNLDDIDLSGKKAGAFGVGDSAFPEFCRSVEVLEDKLKDLGAEIIIEGFKWDGDITSEAEESIQSWAERL